MITNVRVVAVEAMRCVCLPTVWGSVPTTGLYKQRPVKYRYETDISASGTLSNRVSSRYPSALTLRANRETAGDLMRPTSTHTGVHASRGTRGDRTASWAARSPLPSPGAPR